MKQYEVTFIVDPVLSGGEINATAQTYVDHLQNEGCKIVHVDEMGLRQLAYPIKKKTTGVYYTIEFTTETGSLLSKLELALRRDERIMRFLTVALDKYGIKYNDDKRNGLIGKKRSEPEEDNKGKRDSRGRSGGRGRKSERPEARRAVKPEPKPTEETSAKSEEE